MFNQVQVDIEIQSLMGLVNIAKIQVFISFELMAYGNPFNGLQ